MHRERPTDRNECDFCDMHKPTVTSQSQFHIGGSTEVGILNFNTESSRNAHRSAAILRMWPPGVISSSGGARNWRCFAIG